MAEIVSKVGMTDLDVCMTKKNLFLKSPSLIGPIHQISCSEARWQRNEKILKKITVRSFFLLLSKSALRSFFLYRTPHNMCVSGSQVLRDEACTAVYVTSKFRKSYHILVSLKH